jgi:hypothetical protein
VPAMAPGAVHLGNGENSGTVAHLQRLAVGGVRLTGPMV